MRPPLNGSIVSRTGEAHMEPMVFSGIVIRRSGGELTLTGRLRVGLVTAWMALVVVLVVAVPAAGYFRMVMATGITVGILIVVARARTRLVLRPTDFVVSGYEGLRRYRLKRPLAALDLVGVVPMMPQFENMPYKDPDYFLQMVVEGRVIRAFRGLPRRDLDEIATEIRGWKANRAG